jgi:preprotein translocase subunit SecE
MARDRKRAKQRQRQRRAQRQPAGGVPAQRPAPPEPDAVRDAPPEPEDAVRDAPPEPEDAVRDAPPEPEDAVRDAPLEPEDAVRDAPPDPIEHASGDVEIAEAAERAYAELDGPTTPLEPDEFPQPDELEGDDALQEDEYEETAPDASTAAAERATGRAARARAIPSGRDLPREGNRFVNFLRACWAELQRVQWPDRRQVAQATAVVLVFVLVAGGYLGLLDAIFSRVVKFIL